MMGTITAADSVFTLTVAGLYDAPQQLVGYAADRAFETDAVENAELVLGVDGRPSAGWIPHWTMMNITVMPDSPTSTLFEVWLQAEDSNRRKYTAQGSILLPSTGRKYSLKSGFLTSVVQVPSAQRVLQARPFRITWGSVVGAPS